MAKDPGFPPELPPPSRGRHIATVSHEGRFWDVFLEPEEDARHSAAHRARLCFSPTDLNEDEQPSRTATILVEETYDDLIRRAHRLEDHMLVGLLRSVLPE